MEEKLDIDKAGKEGENERKGGKGLVYEGEKWKTE